MSSGMLVRIHGGAATIGGSCVEVESGGARLVLDLGLPLDAGRGSQTSLPAIAGLATGDDPSLLGVVVSHGHPDHYGLVAQSAPNVPRYIGEAAHRILAEAAFFTPMGVDLRPTGFLRDRETFSLGPFRVTPYLCDHSAFDAYGLLVEAGGRRLFYSGDLRGHGRKHRLFERLLAAPPSAHTLLLEGTRIDEQPGERCGPASEAEVEEQALELFRSTQGIVLALYSAQNIDRLVSLYRAAKRAGRLFVLDLYGATIAAATGRPETIPQASWDGVGVFVPLSQRIRVKRERAFDRIAPIRSARLYPKDLAGLADRVVLTFRGSMASELERAGCLTGASALWSLWPGYLSEPSGRQLHDWLDRQAIPLTVAHASGHATVEDLQHLVTAMRPERVVPIHTRAPELFQERFPGACIQLHRDGEWWQA